MMTQLKVKRSYDPYDQADGRRILVDRLWPRGIKKEEAQLDDWLKDIAPTPDLRKWFHEDKERFETFSEKYQDELTDNEAVTTIIDALEEGDVSLIYAAKDKQRNHAVVLQHFIEERR